MGKILVVDSSLLDRKRVSNILEAAGHAVLEVDSPAEAIKLLADLPRGAVKLILTELHFGTESGLGLIRWVKADERWREVPLLVVTQQPARDQVIELVTEGAATIVTKPFGADLLLRRVTRTLAEQNLLRQGEGNAVSWQITDYIRRELKRSERTQAPFSVLVCRFVETLGGRAVPALMSALAPLMRESDILARLGEDQLVVLLPDTDSVGAWTVEDRIWQAVRDLAGESESRPAMALKVTTGAATFPAEGKDPDVLLALAQERAVSRTA